MSEERHIGSALDLLDRFVEWAPHGDLKDRSDTPVNPALQHRRKVVT
jgi:hypothetical protein